MKIYIIRERDMEILRYIAQPHGQPNNNVSKAAEKIIELAKEIEISDHTTGAHRGLIPPEHED